MSDKVNAPGGKSIFTHGDSFAVVAGITKVADLILLSEMFILTLYATGYDANGCLGAPVSDYTMTTPGLTFGFAVNSGRMAGENATHFTRKGIRKIL